jgi:hypothetical protein
MAAHRPTLRLIQKMIWCIGSLGTVEARRTYYSITGSMTWVRRPSETCGECADNVIRTCMAIYRDQLLKSRRQETSDLYRCERLDYGLLCRVDTIWLILGKVGPAYKIIDCIRLRNTRGVFDQAVTVRTWT